MNTEKLRLFTALAETLHFHRASDRCNVSPSTLSRSIQQLESELNSQLFTRDNRSVSLTPKGEHFLQFARETLQQWETLKDSMQHGQEELTGSLSLYCSVTASYSFLYEILADFRLQQPLIEIKLHTGDPALAVHRVISGNEDIAIAAKQKNMPQAVSFKRIAYSPLILIQPLSDSWFRTPASSPSYWQSVPFILSEQGVARERINDWFRQHNLSPNIYAQVAGHEAIVSMVSLGFGLGLVPKIVLDNSPLSSKVKPLSIQLPLKPYELGLCVLNKRLKSPIIKAFWEQCAQSPHNKP